jgi:peptide/nickel transport system substrate-binding protein
VATRPAALEALWLAYTPPLTYQRREGQAGLKLIPGLAERLPTVSNGGRWYSFRLRSGLRYPGGTRVRASDFRHTLLRSRALSPVARRLFADVATVHARDATRDVTVGLRRPDPAFPHALASTFAGFVPARTPVRTGLRRPAPGLGPYELVRTTQDGGFTLRRNADFHLPGIPAAFIDKVTARPLANRARATRAVITGGIDYVQGTPPVALLPDLRSKYGDRYAQHPSLSTRYLLLAARGALKRRHLRQAIAYATDEEKIGRLSHGLVEPTCNIVPPDLPGRRRLDPCPWGDPGGSPDLVKARALVQRLPKTPTLTILARPRDRAVGRYYARTLRTLGVRAALRLERSGRPGSLGPGGGAVLGTVSPGVPDAARLLAGLAPGGGRSARVSLEAAREPDPARRAALAADLEKSLVQRALVLPYGNDVRTVFVSERLDFQNCARFHPLYGNDYSSFCLK